MIKAIEICFPYTTVAYFPKMTGFSFPVPRPAQRSLYRKKKKRKYLLVYTRRFSLRVHYHSIQLYSIRLRFIKFPNFPGVYILIKESHIQTFKK